jgi:uncharacterized BrkB/YihY/UPF0761 family membrane protein
MLVIAAQYACQQLACTQSECAASTVQACQVVGCSLCTALWFCLAVLMLTVDTLNAIYSYQQ